MKKHIFPASLPFVFASLLILALTVVVFHPAAAQAQPGVPTNLRVDISDGATGQLFVTWYQVSGASYYNLQSMPSGGSWSTVANCSGSANFKSTETPWVYFICRDNNGGKGLAVGTTYYYQVEACNSSNQCSGYSLQTATTNNIPISCNCTSSQIPGLQGMKPPAAIVIETSVLGSDLVPAGNPDPFTFMTSANEVAAYHNASFQQSKLLVQLPGSGSTCSLSHFMYTAENLGYDAICVNYDNQSEQEDICAATNFSSLKLTPTELQSTVANCFTNISQAKLNAYGDCTQTLPNGQPNPGWTLQNCGMDSHKNKGPYYVDDAYDAVVLRIVTMLQYLCQYQNIAGANGNPAAPNNTNWMNYLSPPVASSCVFGATNVLPNWSNIVLGGWSQGGDMSTFAAYNYLVSRAVNLSAPPSAAAADYVMTPASYFNTLNSGVPMNGIRSIYGLVSANDLTHYCVTSEKNVFNDFSVYASVWSVLGFTAANHDAELDLNYNAGNYNANNPQPCTNNTKYKPPTTPNPPNPQSPGANGLICTGTPSHNFVNWAAVSAAGGGHGDTLYPWNENIYEFMLSPLID